MTDSERKINDVLIHCYRQCVRLDNIMDDPDSSAFRREIAARRKMTLLDVINILEKEDS